MNEPTVICPNCRTEIKLTESLAAPIVEATRKHYEHELAQKDAEVSEREAAVRKQFAELTKAREAIDEEIAAKLEPERERISAEEAKKARMLVEIDLKQKSKDLEDLQDLLRDRDLRLSEAQRAQAAVIRKQRELDDAKREIDLTIEKKVQESLNSVRDKAKLKLKKA